MCAATEPKQGLIANEYRVLITFADWTFSVHLMERKNSEETGSPRNHLEISLGLLKPEQSRAGSVHFAIAAEQS